MTADKRIDRYIAEITQADLVGDLQHLPKRTDYDSQQAWMEALTTYRDRVITPPTEDKMIDTEGEDEA